MEDNKPHILIVDDDDKIRNLLKDFLSENNYIVSTAENADHAKKILSIFYNSTSFFCFDKTRNNEASGD